MPQEKLFHRVPTERTVTPVLSMKESLPRADAPMGTLHYTYGQGLHKAAT